MPLYGGFEERDCFEDYAVRNLELSKGDQRIVTVADKVGQIADKGAGNDIGSMHHIPLRSESFAMADAVLHHGGISYAGETPARVMPHPAADDHRNLPA